MKKLLVVAMMLVFCTGMVFAAGAQEEETESDVLRLITWSGYAPEELLDEFEEETGITVEVTQSNNEEMISKLRATRGGGFDLAQPSQDRISSVVREYGLYQPLDYSKVEEDQIDPSLLKAVKETTEVDGESYAVPHVYGTSGLIVNKDKAPDATDYSDLLDPEYEGRVSYRLKRPTLIAMGFAHDYDPFDLYDDKEEYQEFLDEMEEILIEGKDQVKTYWENGDQLLELLRSEEVWVAMGWEQGGWQLHAENSDIDYVAPDSGPLAWIDTFAIPARSENVSGAYKFINFMLRPENAAYLTNSNMYGTAAKNLSEHLEPEIADNFERTLPESALERTNWYPAVPPGLEEMEGKTLDRVKAAQ